MEVLALNRYIFVLLWILPTPENTSTRIKLRNIIFSITNLILLIIGVISSACFAIRYVKINLEESLYALMEITSCGCQTYSMIFGFILSSKFAKMFPKLQKIYDESEFKPDLASVLSSIYPWRILDKHADKSNFMEKADGKAKFITTISMKYVMIVWFCSGIALSAFSAFYSIIKTHSIQVERWYDPCKLM